MKTHRHIHRWYWWSEDMYFCEDCTGPTGKLLREDVARILNAHERSKRWRYRAATPAERAKGVWKDGPIFYIRERRK